MAPGRRSGSAGRPDLRLCPPPGGCAVARRRFRWGAFIELRGDSIGAVEECCDLLGGAIGLFSTAPFNQGARPMRTRPLRHALTSPTIARQLQNWFVGARLRLCPDLLSPREL